MDNQNERQMLVRYMQALAGPGTGGAANPVQSTSQGGMQGYAQSKGVPAEGMGGPVNALQKAKPDGATMIIKGLLSKIPKLGQQA